MMRPALLVVDLQAVTLGNARTTTPDELLARVSTLLARFRDDGLPVVHIVSTGTPPGRTSYSVGARTWTDEQAEIAEPVRPVGGEPVLRRAAWSGFAATDLDVRLRGLGVESVVIAGLATPFGIESTARDAYDLGYSVAVVSDAVAGPDVAGHDWTLQRVVPALGRVLTTAEVAARETAD